MLLTCGRLMDGAATRLDMFPQRHRHVSSFMIAYY